MKAKIGKYFNEHPFAKQIAKQFVANLIVTASVALVMAAGKAAIGAGIEAIQGSEE